MKSLSGRFIHGPIWCEWLQEASKRGSSAAFIGVCLWHYDHMCNGNEFKVDWKLLEMTNLCRHTVYKGLSRLESAELITVERSAGSYPKIKILKDKYIKSKRTPKSN